MNTTSLWRRFQNSVLRYPDLGFSLDYSRMRFSDTFFDSMRDCVARSFEGMKQLEAGAVANPDEKRMVGHYWLRSPDLAPDLALRDVVQTTNTRIKLFVSEVHGGKVVAANGQPFKEVLVVGIGGSALGPQLVADALGTANDAMKVHFLDNTDPDGIDRILDALGNARLAQTLVIVISKSGGTKETRNGMLEVQARYKAAGIPFGAHAVAVTGEGSELDKVAQGEKWMCRFPMWDWVGGRTSVTSAVGLLPAALQGFDVVAMLQGAAAMDAKTRVTDVSKNAAMMLALMWHYGCGGRGEKDMVILPYKDRLVLFSKYLQQLVMESIGKEKDLDGKVVNQGLAVYGNKGSTDQHAYVQQLRDGTPNFFATFIEVRKARAGASMEVEPGVETGDYLEGFLRGTRAALYEGGRDSLTISVPEVNAFQLGLLIALYERAVGFYAGLINVNAYHQPGVEAGKKAATRLLQLQAKVVDALKKQEATPRTAEEIAAGIDADAEDVYHILTHLSENRPAVKMVLGQNPGQDRFQMV